MFSKYKTFSLPDFIWNASKALFYCHMVLKLNLSCRQTNRSIASDSVCIWKARLELRCIRANGSKLLYSSLSQTFLSHGTLLNPK